MRRSNRLAHAAMRMLAVLAAGLASHACDDDSVFTTYESFNLHSVGSGELSSESFRVDVITGGVLQVKYLAPRLHCSSVKIHFLVDGTEKALSGAVAPGASSGYFDLGPVPAGRHEVAVRAEGVPGGCNSGQLMSWQGSITVWTSRPGTSVPPPGDHLGSAIFDADSVNYAWGYVYRGRHVDGLAPQCLKDRLVDRNFREAVAAHNRPSSPGNLAELRCHRPAPAAIAHQLGDGLGGVH